MVRSLHGQARSLGVIEESGRHLLSLINDTLDVSKIEAGKFELQIDRVNVEEVCQASLQFVTQAARQKHIKISSTIDSQVTTFYADQRRLKQVLVNLLANAVKFTPEGGAIGLEMCGDAQKQVVEFTVWDTGIGIASDAVERIFQPFTQLDNRLSRQQGGTGLGLALVKQMVELHGGSVAVESEPGKGSRFTVSPALAPVAPPARPATPPPKRLLRHSPRATQPSDPPAAGRSPGSSRGDTGRQVHRRHQERTRP